MKRIVTTEYFDQEKLKEMGYTTERQINSVIAIADVLEQIKNIPEDFGFMCFLLKDAGLLGHRPVEITSNFTEEDQRILFEDYVLSRLKRCGESKHDQEK